MESETLDAQAIMEVLGKRPFEPHENYKVFLDMYQEDMKEKKEREERQKEEKEKQAHWFGAQFKYI